MDALAESVLFITRLSRGQWPAVSYSGSSLGWLLSVMGVIW